MSIDASPSADPEPCRGLARLGDGLRYANRPWLTGNGDILAGSGSVSVFVAVVALLVAMVMGATHAGVRVKEAVTLFGKGTFLLLPLAF